MLLEVKNIKKSFKVNNKSNYILNDLSLFINRNEIVSLYGASGSGKSTLLNIISGLISFDSGEIIFNSKKMDKSFDYVNFRKNDLGIIFQEDHLLTEFNVLENIMLPSIIAGNTKKVSHKLACELLKNFDLFSLKDSYSSTLSGGEKQRISILRSVINNPKLLIADEPTGSIDEYNKEKIFILFRKIVKDYDTSILIATHDNNVSKISNKILNLSKGKIK